LERRLRDDVDRSGLDLDEIDVGVGAGEILPQPWTVGEVAGDADDVGVEPVGDRRARREHREAPSAQWRDRTQLQLGREHGHALQLADRTGIAAADEHDQVGHEHAVRVQVGRQVMSPA
jgi:hypothetical protein